MFKFSKAAKRRNQVDCTANNTRDWLANLKNYWDKYYAKLKDQIGEGGDDENLEAMSDIMYHTIGMYEQNIELMREMNKVMLEVDERTKQIADNLEKRTVD